MVRSGDKLRVWKMVRQGSPAAAAARLNRAPLGGVAGRGSPEPRGGAAWGVAASGTEAGDAVGDAVVGVIEAGRTSCGDVGGLRAGGDAGEDAVRLGIGGDGVGVAVGVAGRAAGEVVFGPAHATDAYFSLRYSIEQQGKRLLCIQCTSQGVYIARTCVVHILSSH